jgi:hypothetical protein
MLVLGFFRHAWSSAYSRHDRKHVFRSHPVHVRTSRRFHHQHAAIWKQDRNEEIIAHERRSDSASGDFDDRASPRFDWAGNERHKRPGIILHKSSKIVCPIRMRVQVQAEVA